MLAGTDSGGEMWFSEEGGRGPVTLREEGEGGSTPNWGIYTTTGGAMSWSYAAV